MRKSEKEALQAMLDDEQETIKALERRTSGRSGASTTTFASSKATK